MTQRAGNSKQQQQLDWKNDHLLCFKAWGMGREWPQALAVTIDSTTLSLLPTLQQCNNTVTSELSDHTDTRNITWQPSMLGTDGLVSTMASVCKNSAPAIPHRVTHAGLGHKSIWLHHKQYTKMIICRKSHWSLYCTVYKTMPYMDKCIYIITHTDIRYQPVFQTF